ncbi:hypothetical protein FB567DRAFT_598670 [Paraphoma chrysanthemicola]|uniref:Uncharacterized protein n=1 Tax=Paraphoma chrysanthemicola TaxID=798071 RepID=A0A8K0QTE0_9PLEO|nr:hypothetical protein FB567DRAFT_598670 [Paraphoma chrysanthemicola]
MNAPGSSPRIDDLQFDWKEHGTVVRDFAYGPKYAKILRNYGLEGEVAFCPQRNADSFAWFALGNYVKQETGTYPRFPRPRNVPVEDPMNSGGGDVKAANANLTLFAGQPPEDLVTDSTEDAYEYAEGFSTPKCPDVDPTNLGGSGSGPANPQPSGDPPAAEKTNALSIIFQKSLDEIGPGHDWLFFPGKRGEPMLCHDQKASWHFTSKAGLNKDGIPPWPTGTFHFDSLFDRACKYKNDGKDNPGMLWCKEKDGTDVGIQCQSDNMRTTNTMKQCTKSGLIPLVEHVAVAYCEW